MWEAVAHIHRAEDYICLAVSRESECKGTEIYSLTQGLEPEAVFSTKYDSLWECGSVTGQLRVHRGGWTDNGCDRVRLQSAGITLTYSSKETEQVWQMREKQHKAS